MNRLTCPLILAVLLTSAFASMAQVPSPEQQFNIRNMLPTSPEAALLGRFGEIPVGYYTGTSSISIPLYVVKEGGLELPVELRYHASGIKVEDEASNVGLGWLLEPGGAIIQIVNGVMDRSDQMTTIDTRGYEFLMDHNVNPTGYFGRNQVGFSVLECGPDSDGNDDSRMTFMFGLQGHGQPDIHHYNFPGGYSGKFYIHPQTHEFVMLDKKHDIVFSGPNVDNEFQAKTLDGHVFVFGAYETVRKFQDEISSYTWKLTEIRLNNGKTINFHYTDAAYTSTSYSESHHSLFPGVFATEDELLEPVKKHFNITTHNVKTLAKITTDSEEIIFNPEDREDMESSVKRIGSVDIKDKVSDRVVRSFKFKFGYFSYNTTGGDRGNTDFSTYTQARLDRLGKRLKLTSVQEVAYHENTMVTKPPHEFAYNETVTLPLKTSHAKDFWGYYNGKSNAMLMPDLAFFFYLGHYPDMPRELINRFEGGDRSPDSTKMKAGILEKITYPTGGFTTFGYQAHSFGNYDFPDIEKVKASTRAVSVLDQNESGDVKSATIAITQNTLVRYSHFINHGNPYYNDKEAMFYDLLPSTIQIKKVRAGQPDEVIHTWSMSTSDKDVFLANGGISVTGEIMLTYETGTSYVLEAEIPDAMGPQNSMQKSNSVRSYVTYDVQADYKTSIGGGLRVSSIKNYSAAGVLAGEKRIRYVQDDNISSGKLMSPLNFLNKKLILFEKAESVGGPGSVTTFVAYQTIWFVASESMVPFSSAAGGNVVGYSRVEVTDRLSNGTANGRKVYHYHNEESQSAIAVPDIPDLKNGSIDREEVFNADNDTLQVVNYTYENKWDHNFFGVMFEQNHYNYTGCTQPVNDPDLLSTSFVVNYYPLNSKWYFLTQKESIQYAETGNLAVKEEYFYNDRGQLVKIESNDSKAAKKTTEYVYPTDVDPANGSIEQKIRTAGLFNNLLEQTSYLSNHEVSKVKFNYREAPAAGGTEQIVKDNIQQSVDGKPLATEVTFDEYTDFRTITQVTDKSGMKTSLLWSADRRQVVAEAKNAAVSDISFAGFEPYETSGWTFNAAAISSLMSRTGKKCFSLSATNPVSRNGLQSNVRYNISYWTRNTAALNVQGTIGQPVKGVTVDGWAQYTHVVSGVSNVVIGGDGYVDDLRLCPEGAQMITYTHEPLVGLTSATDANEQTAYYEYDDFGRLKCVRDSHRNIVKRFDYNYQVR